MAREERRQAAQRRVDEPIAAALADRRQVRHADGEQIGRERHRRAVEVAARHEVAFLGEHHGVVGRGIQFHRHHVPDECQGVARRAVDLRGTAHRVGILDAPAVGVGRVDRAAGQQGADNGGGVLLATERTRRVDPRIERLGRSSQAVD